MLSTNQLKSIKLKLQGKYFDKRQDQEVIIERLNSNFYVQVNRGLNPVKKDKEISFSGTVQQHKARLSSNWVNSFQASEQEKLRQLYLNRTEVKREMTPIVEMSESRKKETDKSIVKPPFKTVGTPHEVATN